MAMVIILPVFSVYRINLYQSINESEISIVLFTVKWTVALSNKNKMDTD